MSGQVVIERRGVGVYEVFDAGQAVGRIVRHGDAWDCVVAPDRGRSVRIYSGRYVAAEVIVQEARRRVDRADGRAR